MFILLRTLAPSLPGSTQNVGIHVLLRCCLPRSLRILHVPTARGSNRHRLNRSRLLLAYGRFLMFVHSYHQGWAGPKNNSHHFGRSTSETTTNSPSQHGRRRFRCSNFEGAYFYFYAAVCCDSMRLGSINLATFAWHLLRLVLLQAPRNRLKNDVEQAGHFGTPKFYDWLFLRVKPERIVENARHCHFI